jgi:hypothetical protein
MAYYKAKLKSNGDTASPYFKPVLTGNTSEKKRYTAFLTLPFHKTSDIKNVTTSIKEKCQKFLNSYHYIAISFLCDLNIKSKPL